MNVVHFGENWGKFTLMAWMPVYYRSTLGNNAWRLCSSWAAWLESLLSSVSSSESATTGCCRSAVGDLLHALNSALYSWALHFYF
eukprot:scaffold281146_cov50-Prasinocladus_malaysianus.AAC.1